MESPYPLIQTMPYPRGLADSGCYDISILLLSHLRAFPVPQCFWHFRYLTFSNASYLQSAPSSWEYAWVCYLLEDSQET